MSEEVSYPACAVCGRRLLAGERPSTYVTREWTEVTVCELCKPRAEAAGWMRPEEAEELRASGGGRERRRPRGQMLGGLLSRFPSQQPQGGGGGSGAAPDERQPYRPADPSPEPAMGQSPADAEMEEALRMFNFSDHRRTVAGLTRTLGPPRACAIDIVAANGAPGFRVTVAWELTWYQWEIAASEHGIEVRESGKGETIDQLRAEDRNWNLMTGNDGTLHRRAADQATGENARR